MAEKDDSSISSECTLEEAEERVRQNPKSSLNQKQLGELLYRAGRYEDAIDPLRKATELLQNELIDFRCEFLPPQHQKLNEFQMEFLASEMVSLEREHHAVYLMCADCLMKQNRNEEACTELEQGLATTDADPVGWNMLGIAQTNSGEPEKALGSFREALRQSPTRQDSWESLQKCYLTLKRPEAQLISEVLGEKRSLEDNMALLVDLFIEAAEYNKARSVIDSLLEKNRNEKRVLFPLSRLHIINGEYKEAEETLKKLVKSDKHNIEALWHLSHVYAIQGKKKDSLKHLEQLLKLDANHSDALELQRKLTTH